MTEPSLLRAVAGLASSAIFTTGGPATLETVRKALASLRSRHPEGDVIAVMSPRLARAIGTELFAEMSVLVAEDPPVQVGADEESSLLYIDGAIVAVPLPERFRVAGRSELSLAIRDLSMVQEIVTPL